MRPEYLAEASLPEVPGYRAIGAVGAGSHGVVFRARDLATQEVAALKVLLPGHLKGLARDAERTGGAASGDRIARARRSLENRIAGLQAVGAPGLVVPRAVVDFVDEENGRLLALAMEYVGGDSLARALQRNVRFAPARAAAIGAEIARALGAAHRAGLVHGALHPGKIILGESGARVLGVGLGGTLPADFDDAQSGLRRSPHVYAAREVLAGESPGEAADAFSLGAILYHVLTGHAPYKARSVAALKVERADGPPVWPRGATEELPGALVHLVDRMTASHAAARPRLESLFLSELSGAVRTRAPLGKLRVELPADVAPLEAGTPAPREPSGKAGALGRALNAARGLLRRPSTTPVMVGGAVVVFLLAVSVLLRPPEEGRPPPDAERAETTESTSVPPEREPEAGAARGPESRPVVEREVEDTTLDDLRAIERIFADNPADAEGFRTSLEELSGREGDAGARARRLLAHLDEHREKRAADEIARLLDRAGALEAAGRYGEALAAIDQFPRDRYALTSASGRAQLEKASIRRRAARAFAEAETRAEAFLARHDLAGARAEYEAVRTTIGIAEWVGRAAGAIARIGRLEEEVAASRSRMLAAEEAKAHREEVASAFAGIARSCRGFRYTDAARKLEAALARLKRRIDAASSQEAAAKIEEDRRRLAVYGQLVRREAAQFRLIAERLRSGKRYCDMSLGRSAAPRRIRDITEYGLTLPDEAGSIEFSWSRVPDVQAYKIMLPLGDEVTNIDERLALAVFAHHRGLDAERDNELSVADGLARSAGAGARAEVKRVREALAEIEIKPGP